MEKDTKRVIIAMMLVAGADEFGLLDKVEEHFKDRDGDTIIDNLEGFLRDKFLPTDIEHLSKDVQVSAYEQAEAELSDVIVRTTITAVEKAIDVVEGYANESN